MLLTVFLSNYFSFLSLHFLSACQRIFTAAFINEKKSDFWRICISFYPYKVRCLFCTFDNKIFVENQHLSRERQNASWQVLDIDQVHTEKYVIYLITFIQREILLSNPNRSISSFEKLSNKKLPKVRTIGYKWRSNSWCINKLYG